MPYGITVLPATRQRWHSCVCVSVCVYFTTQPAILTVCYHSVLWHGNTVLPATRQRWHSCVCVNVCVCGCLYFTTQPAILTARYLVVYVYVTAFQRFLCVVCRPVDRMSSLSTADHRSTDAHVDKLSILAAPSIASSHQPMPQRVVWAREILLLSSTS